MIFVLMNLIVRILIVFVMMGQHGCFGWVVVVVVVMMMMMAVTVEKRVEENL